MRTRRNIALVLSLTLAAQSLTAITLAPSEAMAQPAPPKIRDQLPESARRAWDNGLQLMRNSDCRGALPELIRAYELSKNPRVLFNVAVCEKDMGHYARAASRWEQELVEGEAKLTEAEKSEIRTAITVVRRFVTTITVTSNEDGATLFIDDVEIGKTPFAQPIPIDVGANRIIRLKKEGFKEVASPPMSIVEGKPESLSMRMEPLSKKGLVTVTVMGAPKATIYIDNKDMGFSPFRGEVTAERHTFEARAPGYAAAAQTQNVPYKESLNIVLSLSIERHEGKVKVTATPGARIEIDGQDVGTTSWEGILKTGGHQLVVKKQGYETQSQELTVVDDQVREVKANLMEARARDWIWWVAGALAVVGGGVAIGYFVLKQPDQPNYTGTLEPGVVFTRYRF